MYRDINLLINNEWRQALAGDTLEVVNPSTGAVIGRVACANQSDLDLALEAAEAGFETWRQTPPFDRARIMHAASDLIRQRSQEIAQIMTLEQGKPLAESKAEVLRGADTIDWFAEEARRIYGRTIPGRAANVLNLTRREPVGPVAAFTPWNFPINQFVKKVAAAIAAGCSIITKAPEETPASPAEIVRAFVDAGLPPGVLGLVYGKPAEISEYLIPHPTIRKISFTGSTSVGRQLAALAGLHLKRITLELGGHAPAIVCDDCDLEKAIQSLSSAKFRNAGQVCISPTRFIVQERVFEEFVAGFVAAAERINVGDGLVEGTEMGPLANERRLNALEGLIADARDHGGTLHTGGQRIGNKGFFLSPAVLSDVAVGSRIMNEEPFGPVAVINRFDSLDAAVSEANRTPYGLAAYAFTGSGATSARLAEALECGMLTLNHIGFGMPELPFGGVKDSGYGTEGGSEGIEAYLDTRLITQLTY